MIDLEIKQYMRDIKIKNYLNLNKENYLRPNNCTIFEKLLYEWNTHQLNAFTKMEMEGIKVPELKFDYFYHLDAWINNFQTPNINCFYEIRIAIEIKNNPDFTLFENLSWLAMESLNNIMQSQILNIVNEFIYDMELIYSIYDEKGNSKSKIETYLHDANKEDLSKIWNVLCKIRNIVEHPRSNTIDGSKRSLTKIINLIYECKNENWNSLSKIKFDRNSFLWNEIYLIHKTIMCEIATEINKLVFDN